LREILPKEKYFILIIYQDSMDGLIELMSGLYVNKDVSMDELTSAMSQTSLHDAQIINSSLLVFLQTKDRLTVLQNGPYYDVIIGSHDYGYLNSGPAVMLAKNTFLEWAKVVKGRVISVDLQKKMHVFFNFSPIIDAESGLYRIRYHIAFLP